MPLLEFMFENFEYVVMILNIPVTLQLV